MSKTLTQCRVTAPATSQHEAPDNSRWFENDLATGTKRALTMVWVPTKRAVIGNVVKLTRPDTGAVEEWTVEHVWHHPVEAKEIVSQIAR